MFNFHPPSDYPLHVGVLVSLIPVSLPVTEGEEVWVVSLPGVRTDPKERLAKANWSDRTSGWRIAVVGVQTPDEGVSEDRVRAVADIALEQDLEQSLLGSDCCVWNREGTGKGLSAVQTSTGMPLFASGTCAEFVEGMYRLADLSIVHDDFRDPSKRHRLNPAFQIRACHRGVYPLLESPFEDRFNWYPACLV